MPANCSITTTRPRWSLHPTAIFRSPPTGVTRCTLQHKPIFRYSIYAAFAALFLTGAWWLVADWQKEGDEIWQQIAANLLMVHGGLAGMEGVLLGALGRLHRARASPMTTSRVYGSVMDALNAVL